MKREEIKIEQGSNEWLKFRMKGVGASDSPVLFDVSPYKTQRDLFYEKMGFTDALDTQKEFIFSKGHRLEQKARELYLEKLGIEMIPKVYRYKEIFLASLDGINSSEGILEVKYTGKDNIKRAKEGELPPHHYIQMQHQFYVTGADKGHYVATNDGKDYVSVIVAPNEKYMKDIESKVYEFWEKVLKGEVPPLTKDDTLFITDADKRKKFRELKALYDRKKVIEESYKALEREVKDMCTHPKVSCAGVRVTEYERQGSIDYKSIEELKSVNLEAYRKKPVKVKKLTFGEE